MRHGWKPGCFQTGALLLKMNRKHKVHLRPEVQIFSSYKKGLRRDNSWLKMWFWMKKNDRTPPFAVAQPHSWAGCRSKLLSVFWGHLKHRQKMRPKPLYWHKGQDSVATTEWDNYRIMAMFCSMCLFNVWPPEICV
jgi:hypothetical protein